MSILSTLLYWPTKLLTRLLLSLTYRVKVTGIKSFQHAGKHTLIVANHISLLDPLLIAAYSPRKLTFVIGSSDKRWWMKPLSPLLNIYLLEPSNPLAIKGVIDLIRQGQTCVIFPEGRITVTGALMKIDEAPALIAEKAHATILPIRINGAQYTLFSHLKGKVHTKLFPKITLTVLEPRQLHQAATGKRQQRQDNALQLYDIMADMLYQSTKQTTTLFDALLEAKKVHGSKHCIMEDIERKPIHYRQLITRCFALGSAIAKQTKPAEYVGVLLPSMVNTAITFFAIQAINRVPTMLNFSTGTQQVLLACQAAKLRIVYTSQRFVAAADLQEMIEQLIANDITVIYLEQLVKTITLRNKLTAAFATLTPRFYYRHRNRWSKKHLERASKQAAVVLFTSGSEGTPKGVVLSHANIQANCGQIASRIDFGPSDKIFNALPVFHSFGLTGGLILPALAGIKIFFYPSPLHYRIIPQLIYDTNATILFSTDTFLTNYAKYAHPYDFYSLRYVFAGAEKLKESTRKIWAEQFGIRIFEGYGVTETSPILSLNTPMHHKVGTVGRLLPGIEYRLEPVPGLPDVGKLIVSGANVMLGYLLLEQPGKLMPPPNDEHDTGDVVGIDEQGYVTIAGRAKRFAKIAGEMVSLTAVENHLTTLWPGYSHAMIAIPDERKGEQLVLVTSFADATREAIIQFIQQTGLSELMTPKRIIIADVPLLATGKINYEQVKRIVYAND
jgi:acyl-[acyl-carrier-protein]-phospholipid O-acyltransferase/long-chain-fatty-acid--[acyl-carrier-protein] ligase